MSVSNLIRVWCVAALAGGAACSSSPATPDGPVREAGGDQGRVADRRIGETGLSDARRDSKVQPATWDSLKNAPSVRFHTATLLSDGSVLIAGGEQELTAGNVALVTDTWLYRPSSNTFTSAGKISAGRTGHTATLLADGRVLIVGGQEDQWTHLDNVVIYDPARASVDPWQSANPLPAVRGGHAAVKLGDGRVGVIGGQGETGGSPVDYDSIVIFDPGTGTWSTPALSTLKQKRYYHTATLLQNNKVLIAGGVQSGSEVVWLDTLEIWDPSTGSVTASAAKMSQGRAYHTASLLPTGKVLLVGGRCGSPGVCTLASDQLYDPAVDKIVDLSHQGSPPAGHTATSLFDGRVVVAGGWDSSSAATALVFSPSDTSWRTLPSLPHARGSHTGTCLGDGSVLLVGGEDPQSGLTVDIADHLSNP